MRIEGDGLVTDWGAPDTLRAVVEPAGSPGEIRWVSLGDFHQGQPVVLGQGPSVSTAPLRPGVTTVRAQFVGSAGGTATATATVTVRYRESWGMDLVGVVPYPEGTVGDVWVMGRNAVVARLGESGISIVDVDRIAEVGRFVDPGAYTPDVTAQDGIAYVTNEFETADFSVSLVDISNPAAPRRRSGIPRSQVPGAHNVWLDGSTLYIASPQSGLIHAWDVSNTAQPRSLSTLAPRSGCAHDAYVRGAVLYGAFYRCPAGPAELLVASVTSPASPVVLAHISYPGAQLTHSAWSSADGRYLYVADEVLNAPIRIFDVADPANLRVVGTYQPRLGTVPHQFQVRDARHAFLAHYKNGVEVVDVSDPVQPRLVAFYDTHPGEAADGSTPAPPAAGLFAGAWGVHWTDDGKIVVSDETGGVFVLRFPG